MAHIGSSHPFRSFVLALLTLALLAVPAHAGVTPAESIRVAQIPNLPADATASEVPDEVVLSMSPLLRDPVAAGQADLAARDFTARGITVAREIIVTSDAPATAEAFMTGMSERHPTQASRVDGVSVWKGIPSTDGTVSFDLVAADNGASVVMFQISGGLGLTEPQLQQIGQASRARLTSAAYTPPSATEDASGAGSQIVSVLLIAVAMGLIALIIRESRAPAHTA